MGKSKRPIFVVYPYLFVVHWIRTYRLPWLSKLYDVRYTAHQLWLLMSVKEVGWIDRGYEDRRVFRHDELALDPEVERVSIQPREYFFQRTKTLEVLQYDCVFAVVPVKPLRRTRYWNARYTEILRETYVRRSTILPVATRTPHPNHAQGPPEWDSATID